MESILDNTPELKHRIEQVAEVAGYLWQKGWAERNGGNIVINVTDQINMYGCHSVTALPVRLPNSPAPFGRGNYDSPTTPIAIGTTLPHLKGCYFFCKGTNRRMRDLARWPMDNGSIIRITDDCAHYEIIADKPVKPTSELPSHLSVHNYLIAKGSPYKASLHTHPIELVAMTHHRPFLEKDVLTKILWSMIPETRAFCPKGLGIVPYLLPSSVELGEATIKTIDEGYDVVMWEKHGVFAVDNDIMSAFDQVDVLNKAVQIYMSARNMGFEPEGMSEGQMKELSDAFGLGK